MAPSNVILESDRPGDMSSTQRIDARLYASVRSAEKGPVPHCRPSAPHTHTDTYPVLTVAQGERAA